MLLAGYGLLALAGLHLQGGVALSDEAPVAESPTEKTTREKTTKEATSAEQSSEPVEGILVMRTGAVVSGKIVRTGDLYKIISPYGQAHYPAELVKLHSANLEEAYAKLRETALSHKSANAQITLARWCMTNQLVQQARQELREALVLEPDRADAKRLLREIEDSLHSKRKNEAATQPASTVRGVRPSNPAKSVPSSASNSTAAGSDDDAVTLGGLSREQALQFTRRIQPLLVNTCASAGCHSRDSQSGFRLTHVSPGANSNRNATERNLAQVLEHVDLKKPDASPLLTIPRRHHGRNGRSVFTGQRGDEKFNELQNWVAAVARDDRQRSQHDIRRKNGDERARAGLSDESRSLAGGRSAVPIGQNSPKSDPFAQSSDQSNSQAPLPPASGNPFDPESFNRASNSRGAGR